MNGERAEEMTVFVRAVELGGFSAAARALGLTPSAVSKSISRLEDRLGVRLLNRTTRSLTTTPEGETFLERSRRILADIEEAEQEVLGRLEHHVTAIIAAGEARGKTRPRVRGARSRPETRTSTSPTPAASRSSPDCSASVRVSFGSAPSPTSSRNRSWWDS